ncbi:hypothetical protein VPNG_01832 [Cytospora leucostoma]|uniref:DUF3824 domain-containing protein n=1 Tax=Cytospora leucostoma TaxID=1230097 RepID=A0A423XIM7_9PEZI|nr:hypothetical protein VPNG_01832 [Cytospora leucostoma]
MSYDYDPPRRQRSTRQQEYYRDDKYSDAQDPYLRVQQPRDLVPRSRGDPELAVEEVHRDFPPPGYTRDTRRARSAEPYDYDDDDARSVYTRRSRDDYYDYDRRPRKKTESVYIEEEERKRKRVLDKQEKIIAAIAGAAVVLGGKELYDRREAEQEGTDVHRNLAASAALGAAGALAAYQGAEFYNKHAEKGEKKSTHVVHKGRDGRVTEYYSDDEDDRQKKGSKNFLEAALGAAGLGTALKALTGGSGHDDKHRDRDSRSVTRSRRGSESPVRSGPGSKVQKAAMASLIAGATEAFRVSKEPGGWKGEKAKRILTAAAGAATIDAAQKPGKDGSKLGLAEAVIGGLIGNRMINGPKSDIIEDRKTGRSRSRSRSKSAGGGGSGGMGLAALATAGLGAIGAKKAVDNIRDERSRSRTRSRTRRRDDSVDSYDSLDDVPRERPRSRSRSVVDKARKSLARIGLGRGEGESEYGSPRGSRRGGRHDDDYESRDSRYRDDYDDDRSYRSARSRSRGAAPRERASSRGSVSSSDLGDSDEDEKRAKKMRGKQLLTTGLAAVATIHAAHNVYQSVEKRKARQKAVKEGRLSPEEAKKLKSKALLQDVASVGIAALGVKGAISELKEAREMSHECSVFQQEKEERHKRRRERLERLAREKQKKLQYPSENDYGGDESDDGASQYRSRSRSRSRAGRRAPSTSSRYDDGPRYSDGNPYAALPAPSVRSDSRR